MKVTSYLKICQYSAFLIAIFANSLLLFLIKLRAGSSFGRYRLMMVSFSIYMIGYATVEVLTLPVMHIYKSGIIFYPDSFLKHHKTAGLWMSTLYCGSFALCIGLLAQHFVYRYIAVCKHQKMYYFEGKNLYFWFIPPLVLFALWSEAVYVNYGPREWKADFLRNATLEIFEEQIDKMAYLATVYFIRDQNQVKGNFSVLDSIGAVEISIIMNLCLGICLFCGFQTFKKLNDASLQMSTRTKHLNKQLFWTLGLQTVLPCTTQNIPVGLLFTLPFFEVNVSDMGVLVGVTCCLYPAMDPLIAIFTIDNFRNFLFRKDTSKSLVTKTVSEATRTK